MSWMHWQIRPIYGNGRGLVRSFYAPSMMDAFVQARTMWPGADAWESLGALKEHE